jgi:hypothetical protein
MLNIILSTLAVIVIVLLVIVALQPSNFRVARSTTISDPAPAVCARLFRYDVSVMNCSAASIWGVSIDIESTVSG